MRGTSGLLLLLGLAGCNDSPTQKENPRLAGEWVMMADVLEFPIACGSHGPITYEADGKFYLWGQSGTWQLDGKVLTETLTDFDPLHTEVPPEILGRPMVSTLQWADQNSFVKHYSDGQVRAFRRCPDRA